MNDKAGEAIAPHSQALPTLHMVTPDSISGNVFSVTWLKNDIKQESYMFFSVSQKCDPQITCGNSLAVTFYLFDYLFYFHFVCL
jgi:hypothetical protein